MTKYRSEYYSINKKCVIYSITNVENSKIYIGSTNAFYKRKSAHIRAFENNIHHSVLLQRAYNKYGKGAFEFDILQVVENKLDVMFYEQKWLDLTMCCNPKFGYNILPNAEKGSHGRIMSLEEKKLRSDKMKEVCSRPGYKDRMRAWNKKFSNDPDYRARNIDAWVAKGKNIPKSFKLKAEDLVEIHKLYSDGLFQYVIADKFNVSQSIISLIVSGKRRTGSEIKTH